MFFSLPIFYNIGLPPSRSSRSLEPPLPPTILRSPKLSITLIAPGGRCVVIAAEFSMVGRAPVPKFSSNCSMPDSTQKSKELQVLQTVLTSVAITRCDSKVDRIVNLDLGDLVDDFLIEVTDIKFTGHLVNGDFEFPARGVPVFFSSFCLHFFYFQLSDKVCSLYEWNLNNKSSKI